MTEVSNEHMEKLDRVLEFVNKMEHRLDTQFKRWFTISEAAKYLGVSRSTLVQTLSKKIKPIHGDGRIVRYDREDLDKYWEKKKQKALESQALK